jgi:heptosyltransferase-2
MHVPQTPAILIVGPSWVGDMVMAQALFKTLKQSSPKAVIDVLAPAWTLPLLARMPEVRSGIEMPVGHGAFGWSARRALGRSLRGRYDQAIVLPNSWKSALVPWFAKIPLRTGFVGEVRYGLLNDARKLDKQKFPKTIERFVALGTPEEFVQPMDRPHLQAQSADAALNKLGLTSGRILALCPGAEYGPAKQWPAMHFSSLATQWLQVDPTAQVWIFGSEKDQPIGEQIRVDVQNSVSDRVQNLAGKTSLGEAIDLMALARAVVSNDSGLMHVAAALDLPLVAIFGSSDPQHTPPNGAPEKTKSLWLGLECSPCFKRECPLGHLDCLNKISPEQVLQAVEIVS